MSLKLRTFIKFGASAVLTTVFLMAGCGSDSNPGSSEQPPRDWASELSGNWQYIGAVPSWFVSGGSDENFYYGWENKRFYSGGDNQRFYYSFMPSGDICANEYQKVDDFWLEAAYCFGSWNAEDDSSFIAYLGGGRQARGDVSGETLTLVFCEGAEDCDTVDLPRSSVAAFKESVGTIKVQDPALINTLWHILIEDEDDLRMNIRPEMIYGIFYEDETRGWYQGTQMWYTEGDSLFLMNAIVSNCKIGTELEVEGEYEYESEYEYDCVLNAREITVAEYIHVSGVSLTLNYENTTVAEWEYYMADGDGDNASQLAKRAARRFPIPIYYKDGKWSRRAL